jgi:restriction endonuclease S subunit
MDTKALRQKILDLAIHGKLVPQDPNDEPASVLLQRIRDEKERLVKEGEIKKGKKAVKAVEAGHCPYLLPEGWEWTTVGNIGDVVTGNTPPKDVTYYYGGNIPFFKPTDLEQGIHTITSKDHLTELGYEQSRKLPAKSVLVTCIGATIGKTGLIETDGTCNQQINAIVPSDAILSIYLYYLCISNFLQQEIKGNASATTLPILNKNNFAAIVIPLPPLAEQRRIVSEIERWFSLIDKIENGKESLQAAVKQAKAKILDLAIHGKLVPQDPNDEPAAVLLQRIRDEKERLVKEGKIKKGKKGVKAVEAGHYPYLLPDGWEWCKLEDIAYVASGSTPTKEYFVPKGIPFIKMYNLRNQQIDFDFKPQYITEEVHNGKLQRSRTEVGDLIMNIVGPPLGKLAIIPPTLPQANFNQAAVLIRPYLYKGVINHYLKSYLEEMSEINSITTRGCAGQVNISLSQSQNMRIPLPPLAEQRRIVAKIEELFAQLDLIEAAL